MAVWSAKENLTLSSSKSKTAFFRKDCAETVRQPNITIDGKRMFSNPVSIFLGVRYYRLHSFGGHVKKLCRSMSGCINLLRPPRGMTSGWPTSDRRQVYIEVVRSMLEYAATARTPWMLATTTRKYERVQLKVDRSALSQLKQSLWSPSYTLFRNHLPPES